MKTRKMGLEKWEPFNMFGDLRHELGRIFNRSFVPMSQWEKSFEPDIDIIEEKEKLLVKADLPGFKKEDLEISVEGKLLTIKGERKQESETKEKNYYTCERSYGAFTRMMELPSEVKTEAVTAVCKDGVLEIQLPKTESAKAKQVKIEVK